MAPEEVELVEDLGEDLLEDVVEGLSDVAEVITEETADLFARPSLKPDWMSDDPAVKAAYYERVRKKKQDEEAGKSARGSG